MSKSTTIETMVKLFARSAEINDQQFALIQKQGNELTEAYEEIARLAADGDLQQALAERDIAREQRDRKERVIVDLKDRRDEVLGDLASANALIQKVADLVADEDWLGLKQEFGIDSEPAHPEYLETVEDYESAPVGTIILLAGQVEDRGRNQIVKREAGWAYGDDGYAYDSSLRGVGNVRRKVHQWGTGLANGLANGL